MEPVFCYHQDAVVLNSVIVINMKPQLSLGEENAAGLCGRLRSPLLSLPAVRWDDDLQEAGAPRYIHGNVA